MTRIISISLSHFTQWYTHHLHSLLSSLRALLERPVANCITIIVIGITIALPTNLYIFIKNLQNISQHWNSNPSLSLYLKRGIIDSQITKMLDNLTQNPHIRSAEYISPKKGLKTLQETMQIDNILSILKQNPLPGIIVITPKVSYQSPTQLKELLNYYQQSPLIQSIQLDTTWIQRLNYIITVSKRITYSLAALFGLGVLFIIGNTIRLTTEHYYEEMMVLKLIGATDAFIRRPILYRGLLYGILGGSVAWILVNIILIWVTPSFQALAQSYHQTTLLHGLSPALTVSILTFTTILGIIGSWFSTHHPLCTLP